MFPLLKYTAEQVDDYFAKVTPEMVEASLAKDRHDWFDLLNLISPAAYPFMDAMRKKARLARIKYYGKTVSVYAPLYIGNTCVNHCRYCDFRREHTGTVRRNLTLDEIRVEAEAIRASGIDNLLIVAGEDPKVNSVEHFCDVASPSPASRRPTTRNATSTSTRPGRSPTTNGGSGPSSAPAGPASASSAAPSCSGLRRGAGRRRASQRTRCT